MRNFHSYLRNGILPVSICSLLFVACNEQSENPKIQKETHRKKAPVVSLSDSDFARFETTLRIGDQSEFVVSRFLHMLHIFGEEAKFNGDYIVDLICDKRRSEDVFGDPSVVKTREGVRFPTSRRPGWPDTYKGAESHRDYALAQLALIGVEIDHQIQIDKDVFTLQNVLADSVANFHLKQNEIDWTAVAYAIYFSKTTSTWSNKYGETYSFESLADELVDRGMEEACCGGTHRLIACSTLLDIRSGSMSQKCVIKLKKFIERHIKIAVASQRLDGSWDANWYRNSDNLLAENIVNNDFALILVTGHLTEWLAGLGPELAPPRSVLRRAAGFLELTARDLTNEEFESAFCPYTHVLNSLLILSDRKVEMLD